MMLQEPILQEETLDPADWGALRALGHRMIDDMFDTLEGIGERPVWRSVPDDVRAAMRAPLPTAERSADAVYDEFLARILPFNMGNGHPHFWGWVMGNGTPLAMLADMLASGMNPNVGGGDHVANLVEAQVIDWCKELLGFPPEASGLLVSGGSMANLLGLAVARHARAGFDVRHAGLAAAARPLTLYGSAEMHSSLQRGVELLGLGDRQLRRIPVDAAYSMDVRALRRAIDADLAAGRQPICLIGSAGTTNTGGLDPLDALADVAAEYGLWFHVDGAFGALAALAPELRPLLRGMERADSLAFDLHKWGYLPFEVGGVLVRDAEVHRKTFTLQPDYLKHATRGPAAGELWYSDYGVQLTRGFRALKVWMAFQSYGTDRLGRIIGQNVEQARYLGDLVATSPHLELLAPVTLNVVCFRYLAPGLDGEALDALNEELLMRIQESGSALPSGTRVEGHYALRCSITNHRTRREDLAALVADVVHLGTALLPAR